MDYEQPKFTNKKVFPTLPKPYFWKLDYSLEASMVALCIMRDDDPKSSGICVATGQSFPLTSITLHRDITNNALWLINRLTNNINAVAGLYDLIYNNGEQNAY